MAEPGGSGSIGPYPPGVETDEHRVEYEKLRRRVLWKMPYGLYLIGSRGNEAHLKCLMTANWVTQLSFAPKLVGVGIERSALTHEFVETGDCFSVCFIDRDDRAIVRKFTKPVEVDVEAHPERLRVHRASDRRADPGAVGGVPRLRATRARSHRRPHTVHR
jgi:flavin reductase (DIM6/NTAB) family NADH-FMN oxidoreductase RutF